MREYIRRFPLRPGPGLPIYLALLVITLIGTQALRSTVSAMLMYLFLILLPLAIVYMVVGILSVHTYLSVENTRVHKMEEVKYQIELVNHAWIPFPVVDVYQSIPREDGIRCMDQKLVLCLLPSGAFHFDGSAVFRFRGTYEIGISSVVITDLFRLFSYTKHERLYYTILVYPRQLGITEVYRAAEIDDSSISNRRRLGSSATQISDVREYREGDLLRNVHWKLSSKGEELLVKDYQTNEDQKAYLIVDFSKKPEETKPEEKIVKEKKTKEPKQKQKKKAKQKKKERIVAHLLSEKVKGKKKRQIQIEKRIKKEKEKIFGRMNEPEPICRADAIISTYAEEVDERIADGICEIALARLMEKLRAGQVCHLIWYDERKPQPLCHHILSSMEDVEEIYSEFATTPICSSKHHMATLFNGIDEKQNLTISLVSGHSEEGLLRSVEVLPKMAGDAFGTYVEWLFYHPIEIYAYPTERNKEIASIRERMASSGIDLKTVESLSGKEHIQSFYTL